MRTNAHYDYDFTIDKTDHTNNKRISTRESSLFKSFTYDKSWEWRQRFITIQSLDMSVRHIYVFSIALLMAGFVCVECFASPATLTSYKQLEWKNRLVIIRLTAAPERVLNELRRNSADIDERAVVWFTLQNDQILTNFAGKHHKSLVDSITPLLDAYPHEVILIGKDGEVKYTSTTLELDTIFGVIDSMPMRIHEMQH